MKETTKVLTPPYGRYLIRLTRPFPNFDFSFIKPVRRRAVQLLRLSRGGRVLDVGCGPGGSFPYLVDAVGPSGKVVGVEISPAISVSARNRIVRNSWKNVEVIESAAEEVELSGMFDGLIMFAAPDVYASEAALDNIFPHLKDNARVAVFGGKFSSDRCGRILNPVLRTLFKLSFKTTPGPNYKPWGVLAKRLEGLEINEYFFGMMFLASGSVARKNG